MGVVGEPPVQAKSIPASRAALDRIAAGPLREQLRVEMAKKHHRRSVDDIGDAFQEACSRALTHCPWHQDHHVYGWLRRTMDNLLNDQERRERREQLADTTGAPFLELADSRDEPSMELGRRQDRADLKRFHRSVGKLLSDRQRRVWALHAEGAERKTVAAAVGASEKAVKKDLERIYGVGRDQVVSRSGHGCSDGERLMVRLAFGLATAAERVAADRHFLSCETCGRFYRRLIEWQEKVAVLLPLPATEQASPGMLERTVHKALDTLGSVKQQVGDAGVHAKQNAAATYYRAVDPTPLSGMRPGAAATVIAGCLALGGGGAYCVERGTDPITGLVDVIQPAPDNVGTERPRRNRDPAEQAAEKAPPPQAQQPAEIRAPPPSEPQPAPPPEPQPQPEPTPAGVQFGEPATVTPAQTAPPTPAPAAQPARPAPVPQNGGTDLYGP
jgi:RNA polymerase sigma factor (sigma-70 family)